MSTSVNRNLSVVQALETRLEGSQTALEAIQTLGDLAWELRISQPRRAYALARQAHGLSQSGQFAGQPHAAGLAAALVTQAFVEMHGGELSKAISRCLEALVWLEAQPDPAVATRAWFTSSWNNFFLGDYPTALDHGLQALQLAREGGHWVLQAWAMDAVAACQSTTGDFDHALPLHQESLRMFRLLGDAEGELRVLNNYATTLFYVGRLPEALEAAQPSLELARLHGLEMDFSNNCCTVAQILLEMGRLNEAQDHLEQALRGFTAVPNVSQVYALEMLGRVYTLRQLPLEAEAYLQQALSLAEAQSRPVEQAMCHRSLSEAYESQGRLIQALTHFKQFHRLQETTNSENASKRLEVLRVTYQLETAQQEAEIYRLKSAALQHQVEEQQRLQQSLERQSRIDPLTSLPNRRHFDEALAAEYSRHIRSRRELSMILLDVDFFKTFNDTYGHVRGDECLQQVALALQGMMHRPSDLVARYGGEEFVCILPETDLEGAVTVAEKLRQAVLALAVPHSRSSVAGVVTVSLGVVTARCVQGEAPTYVVARADQQLYRAKTKGRNRIEAAAVRGE